MSISIGNVLDENENPSAFGPCCDAVTGVYVVPLTLLTATDAEYEDTFENFCEGLDLHILAEMRVGEEETCEFEVTVTVLNSGSPVSLIAFNASIPHNTNCAAFNNFALSFATYTATASMLCDETGIGCTVTAV